MKHTTKIVIGTVTSLMVVGMITSFAVSSQTYFFGQKNIDSKVALRPVANRSIASELQTSILTNDNSTNLASSDQKSLPTEERQTMRKREVAPKTCSEQNLYTYLGNDNGSLLYGMCIPCPMNKFNVQQKVCAQ